MQPRTMTYAFLHWLNLLFLAGVGYATFRTGKGEVLGAGLALEAFWLAAGARLSGFQRYVALRNGQIEQKLSALRSLEAQQQLSYEYKQRYRDLEKAKAQVLEAAKANKRLEHEAIAPELAKIDELLASFIRIAIAHKKLTQYLTTTTQGQLEAGVQKARDAAAAPASDPMLASSLKGQLELAERRLAEHGKIVQTEKALSVQLETIEQTLGYLKTKIVSLEKPADFGQEIDSVVMGVEAAERTLEATDKIEAELKQLERRAVAGS